MKLWAAGETSTVDPITEAVASGAVSPVELGLFHIPACGGQQHAARVLGLLGDDVDDAVYGIGSPDGSSRTTYYFDPVDVFQHEVLNFPVNSREQRRVHGSTVDENTDRLRKSSLKSTDTNRPFPRVHLRDIYPRHEAKKVRDAGRAGPPDVFRSENGNSGWGSESRGGFLRDGHHFELRQFFETKLLESCGSTWFC